MSLLAVQGGATGTGTVTLLAPSTSTNRTLTLPDATGTVLTSATTTGFPAGSVLQVVSTTKADTSSFASASFVDISGLSVTITPTSTNSKMFVVVQLGLISVEANLARTVAFRLMRNSTAIGVGDPAGSRMQSSCRVFSPADSNHGPSTSFSVVDTPGGVAAITYKVQIAIQDANTAYINRTANDTDGAQVYQARAASSFTVMEIAA